MEILPCPICGDVPQVGHSNFEGRSLYCREKGVEIERRTRKWDGIDTPPCPILGCDSELEDTAYVVTSEATFNPVPTCSVKCAHAWAREVVA